MSKQTLDPATWSQGRLLQKVYSLKSVNSELLEALKLAKKVINNTYGNKSEEYLIVEKAISKSQGNK